MKFVLNGEEVNALSGIPTKFLTKEEYAALSEEEKMGDVLYVVDEPPVNISSTTTSGASDVYSEEETVIGTWIDGKSLYRRVWTGQITGNNDSKTWITVIPSLPVWETVVNARFIYRGSVPNAIIIGEQIVGTQNANELVWTNDKEVRCKWRFHYDLTPGTNAALYVAFSHTEWTGANGTKRYTFILEYTKSTDTAE